MRKKVLVGVSTYPGHAYCRVRFVETLKRIAPSEDVYIVWNGGEIPEEYRQFRVDVHRASPKLSANEVICAKQNMIRNRFLNGGKHTHLLMLESDEIPPDNVIETLTSHNKDIVSAMYFIRGQQQQIVDLEDFPRAKEYLERENKKHADYMILYREGAMPTIWGFHRSSLAGISQPYPYMKLWDLEDWLEHRLAGERLVSVWATGLGCVLISRKVLESVRFMDHMEWSEKTGMNQRQLTDYIFFDNARNAGFDIYADLECIIQHLHVDIPNLLTNKKWFNDNGVELDKETKRAVL